VASKETRMKELDELSLSPSFWDDQATALKVLNEKNELGDTLNTFFHIQNQLKDINDTYLLIKENYDEELHNLISDELINIEKELEQFEISILLSDKFDNSNAIMEIHPGAGGTESQDWANMLYRMYVRFAEENHFKIQVIDYLPADDAGIKSVYFIVKGKFAYGKLKSEKGVHRLVRISPFDANKRRHTSFASVDVVPQMEDNINIKIEENDLKIDTYRSQGAGGQNVNKTDSAVRITHLPTGIVVTCQVERSQIQNREIAMNVLKSKLYLLEQEQKKKELLAIRGELKNIEWGSQIRSYVFCPYTMVKDHRTNYETGDVYKVLDGDLDEIIYAYLKWEVSNHE
jgi:peptide chain release factor 2